MKILSQTILIFYTLAFPFNTSWATYANETKNMDECNILVGRSIVKKLGPGLYEVALVEQTEFCDFMYGVRSNCRPIPGQNGILITNEERFSSAGTITSPIHYTIDEKPREVTLKNGFKQKMIVLRESEKCKKIQNKKWAELEKQRATDEARKIEFEKEEEKIRLEQENLERLKSERREALWK